MSDRVVVWRSTYREVNFTAFGHLFWENSEKVEDGPSALGIASEGRHNSGEDILPGPQLYRQYRQADAELHPNRFGPRGKLLEEQEDLVTEGREVGLRDLCYKIVGNLARPCQSRPATCWLTQSSHTFPFSVVAANSRASASALDCRIVRVVVQASFYKTCQQGGLDSRRPECSEVWREVVRTDFWNLVR
jgi:hypothetical protein